MWLQSLLAGTRAPIFPATPLALNTCSFMCQDTVFRPGNSEWAFSVFESSCHLSVVTTTLPVYNYSNTEVLIIGCWYLHSFIFPGILRTVDSEGPLWHLSQAATCYYRSNYPKVYSGIPLSAMPIRTQANLAA